MAARVNRCIELLEQGIGVYYTGHHTGHELTYKAGKRDAGTWADYINIGMEHGAFDMGGLMQYMRGLVDAGTTRSGHRTPTVIIEAPVNGTSEANVLHNAWQFRQILGRGAHGIILCQAETPEAVRAFVDACRYPIGAQGVDPAMPSPLERMAGKPKVVPRPGYLGVGTRGQGSEAEAGHVWGLDVAEYKQRCDPWPLNPRGELMLGVKLESPEGVARCEEILAVPGLAYAEIGPGDLGFSLGYLGMRNNPYPPELQSARDRILRACQRNGVKFLEACWPENVRQRIDDGVRVLAGGREDSAVIGRAYQGRTMAV